MRSKDYKLKTNLTDDKMRTVRRKPNFKFYIQWLLSPNGLFVQVWENFILVASILTTLLIIYQASFNAFIPWVWAVSYLLDAIYMLDIVLQFFFGYIEKGITITTTKQTIKHYIKTTFLIDIASIIPFELLGAISAIGPSPYVATIARLNRILRLYKIAWLVIKNQASLSVDMALIQMIKYFSYIVILLQVAACAHYSISCRNSYLTGSISCNTPRWHYDSPYVWPIPTNLNASNQTSSYDQNIISYLESLYWGLATITSIGFGDIVAIRTEEKFISILFMLSGSLLFGFIIGSITSTITNSDSNRFKYNQRIKAIVAFTKEMNVSDNMRNKIWQYYEYLWNTKHGSLDYEVMEGLPQHLHTDISIKIAEEFLVQMTIFQGASESFYRALALGVESVFYLASQVIARKGEICQYIHYIRRGVAVAIHPDNEKEEIATFEEGTILGEMQMVYHFAKPVSIIAQSNCEILRISRADINKALLFFPEVKTQMRKIAENKCDEGYKGIRHDSDVSLESFGKLENNTTNIEMKQTYNRKSSNDTTHSLDILANNTDYHAKRWFMWPLLVKLRNKVRTKERFFFSGLILSITFWSLLIPYMVSFISIDWFSNRQVPTLVWVLYGLLYIGDFFFIVDSILVGNFDFDITSLSNIVEFVIDVISCFPIEIFGFIVSDPIMFAKVMWCLRLNRLIKWIKIKDYFKALEDKLGSKVEVLRCIKYGLYILVSTHIVACIWFCIATFEGEPIPQSWADFYKLEIKKSQSSNYVTSLYFSAVTLTSTGFGDIHAQTVAEKLFVMVVTLVGILLYGYCLATLASTLANNALSQVAFQEKISAMHNFIDERHVSACLRERIDQYFEIFWRKWNGQASQEQEVMADMPKTLQENLATEIKESVIRKIPLFSDADSTYMRKLCRNTCLFNYSPGEIIIYAGDIGREMYFIRRGTIEILDESMSHAITTIGPGGFFGEIGLLFGTPRTVSVRASTYCEVVMLDRDAVKQTVKQGHPLIKKHLDELMKLKNELVQISNQTAGKKLVQMQKDDHITYKNLYNTSHGMLNMILIQTAGVIPHSMSSIVANTINPSERDRITRPFVTSFDNPGTIKSIKYRPRVPHNQSESTLRNSFKKTLRDRSRTSIAPVKLSEGLRRNSGWFTQLTNERDEIHQDSSKEHYKRLLKKCVSFFMLRISFLPYSKFYKFWEVAFTFLSFLSFVLVCLQAAFLPRYILLITVNYCIDIFFVIDMIIKLHTAYFNKQKHLITYPADCSWNYINKNFILDLLSNFPTEIFVPIIIQYNFNSYLKILSLLRMNRILRFYKIPLAFSYITNNITKSTYMIRQIEFIILLFLLMHLLGSIWFLLAQSHEYFSIASSTTLLSDSWAMRQNLLSTNSSSFKQYITSLYWAAVTTSTVGYGDIFATTMVERIYVSLVVIIGILYYGFVMANVAAYIANADALMAGFKEKMMDMLLFLKDEKIDAALQKRIMNFFKFLWAETKGIKASELFKEMPLGLQGDVALNLYKRLIDKVPLFDNTEIGFSKLLALSIRTEYFPKGEYVVRKGDLGSCMYFINRGTVDVVSEDGSTVFASMGSGKFFGEISVLSKLPRTASIRAASNCALFVLHKEDLDLALEAYPYIKEYISQEAERRLNLVKKRSEAAKVAKQKGADAKAAAEAAAKAAKDNQQIEDKKEEKPKEQIIENIKKIESDKSIILTTIPQKRNVRWYLKQLKSTTVNIWNYVLTAYEKYYPIKRTIKPHSKIGIIVNIIELLLLYISTVTVLFQGCFNDQSFHLFAVNYFFELCFIVLVILKFHTAFIDEENGQIRSGLKEIAEHYLKQPSEFGIDAISLIPLEIFCLAAAPENRLSYLVYFRLIHAIRGLRIQIFLSKQEKVLSSLTVYVRIIKFIVLITLCLHVVGCVWFLLGCQLNVCNANSWAVTDMVTITTFDNVTKEHVVTKGLYSLMDQYFSSMYWTVATMTTTGYGDIVPTQSLEMIFAIILIPIGRFVMGYIIGNITSTLASLNAQKVQYQLKFTKMMNYMNDMHLPKRIQSRVKSFFEYRWARNKGNNQSILLEELPYCLRCELLSIVNKSALEDLPVVKDLAPNIKRHITILLEPLFLTPGENVAKIGDAGHELYYIRKGKVRKIDEKNKIQKDLGPGEYFGLREEFTSTTYKDSYLAVTHCDLVSLTRDAIEYIKEAYDTEDNKSIGDTITQWLEDPKNEF